jgi:hypothetical protein
MKSLNRTVAISTNLSFDSGSTLKIAKLGVRLLTVLFRFLALFMISAPSHSCFLDWAFKKD